MNDAVSTDLKEFFKNLLIESTDKLSDKIKSVADTVNSIKGSVLEVQGELNIIKKTTLLFHERKLRRNNVLIFGIEEEPNNNVAVIVCKFYKNFLDLSLSEQDINYCYRIGKRPSGNRSRPIILELVSYFVKLKTFKNCGKLKGTNFSICNDMCPEDLKLRKTLYSHLKKAKESGFSAKIVGTKLLVNATYYSLDELENDKESNYLHRERTDELSIEEGTDPSAVQIPANVSSWENTDYINKSLINTSVDSTAKILAKTPTPKRPAVSPTKPFLQPAKLKKTLGTTATKDSRTSRRIAEASGTTKK